MSRFRDPTMLREYEAAVRAFETKHRDLFLPDGTRKAPGSSFASFFWKGYDGTQVGAGFVDRASRSMIAYAYYKAGEDCRRRFDRRNSPTKAGQRPPAGR